MIPAKFERTPTGYKITCLVEKRVGWSQRKVLDIATYTSPTGGVWFDEEGREIPIDSPLDGLLYHQIFKRHRHEQGLL